MYIQRNAKAIIQKALQEYPVVTITGPRQAGKTTLAKDIFPEKPYVSLENPSVRLRASQDPEGFLLQFPDGAILDEIQRIPDLLSFMQVIVDEKRQNGMFIITGSSTFLLMEKVTQSLAGRTALIKLLPFSVSEAKNLYHPFDVDTVILYGGYPRLIAENPEHQFFFQNYIETYVERDIRTLLNIKDEITFLRFVRLCAGRIGSILDYSSIANDTGISTKTVREWISVLQASFVLFLLPPWFENRGKRLVKSPKLYFYDTGLACSILGINSAEQLSRDPLRGSLFENLVILETMKEKYSSGKNPDIYFYRDSNGNEVDLVECQDGRIFPAEIKSAVSFTSEFTRGLNRFCEEYKDKIQNPKIIYNGKESFVFKGIQVKAFLE